MPYRESRNFEASVIKFLTDELATDWENVQIEKTFARVSTSFNDNTPVVCVRVGITTHDRVEIGSFTTKRNPLIIIDIFANNDGQKLDLKDYIIEKIKGGLNYYEFVIENNVITGKIKAGAITVKEITDMPVYGDIDKNALSKVDRYRWRITLLTTTSLVED